MIAKEKQEPESNVHDDYAEKLLQYMNKEAVTAQPSQEKKAQPDEVDALISDLLKQVKTESGPSPAKPESAKTESLPPSIGTQKPKADIPKTEQAKSAAKAAPAEKSSAAPATPALAAPKTAMPVFAASAKQKSKTPFIAVACVCALAAIGIPVYIFTGSSSQAPKSASSQPAASAAPVAGITSLPAGQTAAVPTVKVVPKYPKVGVRAGVSGSVVLELSIDSDGMVAQSKPVSGNPLFYNAAIETANQWRFKPATANGKSVASRTRITLYFRP
jgi:periplasmic protein TonB